MKSNIAVLRVLKYRDKKLMKDDVLKLARIISSDLFLIKCVKILTIAIFLLNTVYLMVQVLNLMWAQDFLSAIKYIPTMAATYCGVAVYSVIVFRRKFIDNLLVDFECWAADSGTFSTEQKIRRECNLFTIFAIVNNVSTVFVGLMAPMMFEIPFDTLRENMFALFAHKILMIFLVAPFSVHLCRGIYFTQHVKFQMFLLRDHIKYLMRGTRSKKLQYSILQDRTYQREIEERLKFCMGRYSDLLRVTEKYVEAIRIYIVLFASAGTFVGIGATVLLAIGPKGVACLPRCYIVAQFCVSLVAVTLAGQTLEDEVEKVTQTFLSIPWYEMDHINRKYLITFLPFIIQPFSIKFMDNLAVNNKITLRIFRGIYSLCSVLLQFKARAV